MLQTKELWLNAVFVIKNIEENTATNYGREKQVITASK